jgi:uncharacterized protein (TIGR04255 family)
LTVGHIGLYWAKIRKSFGSIEEQAPIIHIVEPTDGPAELVLGLQLMDKPELPRVWFLDDSGNRIIQLQRDRFLHNWRKMMPEDEYPRFPSLRESFFDYWKEFNNFLRENGLEPDLDQCDLTYVNHISKGEGWNTVADLENIFTTFVWRTRSKFLPAPDSLRFSLKFLLPENGGRLHIDAVPVRVPPKNDPAIRFSLTARGRPQGEINTESMYKWFTMAREWIVKGFADLVDNKTDEIWDKKG